jgi:ribonuclease R
MQQASSEDSTSNEAQKYANPIPDRDFIMGLLERVGTRLNRNQLAKALKLKGDDQIEALRRRLRAMERDGQLTFDRRDGYGLIKSKDRLSGTVIGHRDGYGFIALDTGGKDLTLHRTQMQRVMDGDRVEVIISGRDQRGREEARIIKVLEHKHTELVGRLQCPNGEWVFVSENKRISTEITISSDKLMGAKAGQFVIVEISQYADLRNPARGEVVEIIGNAMAPGMEIEIALRNHDIPDEWPDSVVQSAEKFGETVQDADKQNRIDLRDTPFVTIDGEDAKDFDDAVYCRSAKTGGWQLLVAIADVSHYVKPGSDLDEEASNRATSVYFPGYVVPMLPESLSNGLCSLNPDVDRLVMVCEMNIHRNGELGDYQFYEGVIRSHARLTYTQVGALLESPDSAAGRKVADRYANLVPDLKELHQLYQALTKARGRRGAIEFETVETRIEFNHARKIERIVPVVRNDAHKLIEECMLCANVATARFLQKLKIPALYRVHEGPQQKKLDNLRAFLAELGLNLGGGDKPTPKDYDKLMGQIAGRADARVIQTMLLRSMNQAVYSPDNKGHFGLAYSAYAHFTSPIRRYPDLLVHRAIRSVIRGGESGGVLRRGVKLITGMGSDPVKRIKDTPRVKPASIYPYDMAQMLALGEHCSAASRSADEASWEVDGWLKCEYMQSHIGDEFDGLINSVTNFGLFIELPESGIEGLVHITALHGDFYHFDAAKQRLTGEKTRTVFKLGDKIRVRVARVDLDQRQIEFEVAGANAESPRPKRKPRNRR